MDPLGRSDVVPAVVVRLVKGTLGLAPVLNVLLTRLPPGEGPSEGATATAALESNLRLGRRAAATFELSGGRETAWNLSSTGIVVAGYQTFGAMV